MDDLITVHVVKYRDRRNLVMRYVDPLTGRQVQRSAGTTIRSKAEKAAAKWEAELQEGRYQRDQRMRWEDFRELWEHAKGPTLRPRSFDSYCGTLNTFERACRPQRLADLSTPRVVSFAASLRQQVRSEATVAKHLRALKAVARWANRQGLLPTVPTFDMPKTSDSAKMKGRPITLEEFERMLSVCDQVVGTRAADSWRLLLRGLWASGLRLGEALALRWDHQAGGVSVALDGKRSVLLFDGAAQKNGKAEAVALAPEAVELLEPLKRENGHVFEPLRRTGALRSRDVTEVGRVVTAIGKAAGVITDPATGKTASAHDLRRAFGYRWSRRVMPADLKAIMRHASITTTMTFYVGEDAKATAATLWSSCENMGRGTISGTSDGQRTASDQPHDAVKQDPAVR